MEPGTKVKLTKGPLGLVDPNYAVRFVEETAVAGDTGTVLPYFSGVDGYLYVEMDDYRLPDGRPAVCPVPPAWVEVAS